MSTASTFSFYTMMNKTSEEKKKLKEVKEAVEIKNFLKSVDLGYMKKQSYLDLGVIYTFIDDNIALSYFNQSLLEDSGYEKANHEIDLCKFRINTNTHFY